MAAQTRDPVGEVHNPTHAVSDDEAGTNKTVRHKLSTVEGAVGSNKNSCV